MFIRSLVSRRLGVSATVAIALGAAALVPLVPTVAQAMASESGPPIGQVRFLGDQTIAQGTIVGGTTVAGLSGLDYDPGTNTWYVISDDNTTNPARFYTAQVALDDQGLHGVTLTGSVALTRPDGSTYPVGTVNPESIRLDPTAPAGTPQLWWGQEGVRTVPADGSTPTLVDPSIRVAGTDGSFQTELPLDSKLHMSASKVGPRNSAVLEGLTFAANGHLVVSSVEGPLYQDGPMPTPTAGALTRLIVQDRTGGVRGEFAYPLDPVFSDSNPPGIFAANGISEILALDNDTSTRFLVIERAFAYNVGFHVSIYLASTEGATDVKELGSLAGQNVKPVRKQLLLDTSTLPVPVSKLEGIAWGPRLSTGERTLVLVSDNDYRGDTHFLALAVPGSLHD